MLVRQPHVLLALLMLLSSLANLHPAPLFAAAAPPERIHDVTGVSEHAVLRGWVTIEAVVPAAVETVAFHLDGPRQTTHIEYGAPFTLFGGLHSTPFGWNTATWPDGSYRLRIRACDRTGCDTVQRRFLVANTSTPQIVRLHGVPDSAVARGQVAIEAVTVGRVDRVVFGVQGSRTAITTTQTPPFRFLPDGTVHTRGWDTTTWPDGRYILRVQACDDDFCSLPFQQPITINNAGSAQPAPTAPSAPHPVPTPSVEPTTQPPWESFKPKLFNPKTVTLTDHNSTYHGNGSEDIVVVVPEPLTKPARIGNVRNLVMIGAEFTIGRSMPTPLPSVPATCRGWEQLHAITRQHKALALYNIAEVAYLEGLYINGTNGNLSEGLQIYDTTGRNPDARFYIINSRLEGAWSESGVGAVPQTVWPDDMPACAGGLAGRPKFNKPDLIEGMYGSYVLWNVSARGSAFQGLYFTPEHGNTLGTVELYNVNIADTYRQGFAIRASGRATNSGPVWTRSDNVWLHHDVGFTWNTHAEAPYMYYPPDKPEQLLGTVDQGRATWLRGSSLIAPNLTILRGVPPQGDIAPAAQVGRHYAPAFFAQGTPSISPPSTPILPSPAPITPTRPLTSSPTTWEALKPVLQQPRTVYLSNETPSYEGNGREDVVVMVQERLTQPASISNVRNLVLVGGEFTIAKPLPPTYPCGPTQADLPCNARFAMRHKALSLWNISGVGYLEGIYINGTNGNLSEGIQIWGDRQGKIIIVNARIEGVRTIPIDLASVYYNHPDLIQLMAGGLELHNVTLLGSDFQGVFMKAEHGNALGDVRLTNVNVRDVARQSLWPYSFAGGGKLQSATNVYVEEATRTGAEGGYLPRHGRTLTAHSITWTGNPHIADGVTFQRGNPAHGDFAPAACVGNDYTPTCFGNVATRPPTDGNVPWLRVEGRSLLDDANNPVVLRGVSTIDVRTMNRERPGGITATLQRIMALHPTVIRLPVSPKVWHADPEGYVRDHLDPAVRACVAQGVYCIIDYHAIANFDDKEVQERLRAFWQRVAPVYNDVTNVLYEVFNEPIGPRDWGAWHATIQPVVDQIRRDAPHTIVLVGAPNWSRDTAGALQQPITGGNIVYTAHVYPEHNREGWDTWIGNTARQYPLLLTEWGFDSVMNGDPTTGSIAAYGEPFRHYVEGLGNVGTVAWVFDYEWTPRMVDRNYQLQGGPNEMGEFTRQWLADMRYDNNPVYGR